MDLIENHNILGVLQEILLSQHGKTRIIVFNILNNFSCESESADLLIDSPTHILSNLMLEMKRNESETRINSLHIVMALVEFAPKIE